LSTIIRSSHFFPSKYQVLKYLQTYIKSNKGLSNQYEFSRYSSSTSGPYPSRTDHQAYSDQVPTLFQLHSTSINQDYVNNLIFLSKNLARHLIPRQYSTTSQWLSTTPSLSSSAAAVTAARPRSMAITTTAVGVM